MPNGRRVAGSTGRNVSGDAVGCMTLHAYLDHAATTPMRPEAVAAMLPFLTDRFGNPSGVHRVSRAARAALDEARETVAACLGSEPGEVVFTGGGTEADNLAIAGVHATARSEER